MEKKAKKKPVRRKKITIKAAIKEIVGERPPVRLSPEPPKLIPLRVLSERVDNVLVVNESNRKTFQSRINNANEAINTLFNRLRDHNKKPWHKRIFSKI